MRRTLALLPALALAATTLPGCSDEASAAEVVRNAPALVAEQGTARVEITVEVGDVEVEGEGVFDLAREEGSMTMTIPPPVGGEVETLFSGTTIYLDAAALGQALPGGAQWVRIDYAELADDATGVDLEALTQGSNDPTSALQGLEAVAEDDIEDLGTDEIDGVEVTGYAAEVDVAAAYEDADAVTDDERFEAFLAAYGDEPVETEVWIDGDGLVRRQVVTYEVQGTELTQTMTFSDFGEPVDVEIPEGDEVVDLLDLIGTAGDT